MRKAYISGKITGLNIEVARANFKRAEAMLQAHGYETVNPFDNGVDEDAPWEHHMCVDLHNLRKCEYIYQMSNWVDSRGAKCEYKEALKAGVKILRYENGDIVEITTNEKQSDKFKNTQNMSEEQSKYVKQSTIMKLNYKWEALRQHAEDESYYWTELYTPIGSFTIATNRTSDPGNFAVYSGANQRPRVLVGTVEEGKEFVDKYLREKAEELQSFIIPIILEEWINSPQELIPIPKLEDDFNYLRGFYDGVNKQLNTINK